MKKIVDKKFIFGIIIGLILSATTVYAVTCVAASDVSFTSTTGLSSTNVQDAINQVDNKLWKYTSLLDDLRNDDVVIYNYDQDKSSSTYCIYGNESTCTTLNSNPAGVDLPIGTIVSVKNNNSSSRSNFWVISSYQPQSNSYNLLSQDNYKISGIENNYTDTSIFTNKIDEYKKNFDYIFKNNSKVGMFYTVNGNISSYIYSATMGPSYAIDTDDYGYIGYNFFASEPTINIESSSNRFSSHYIQIAEMEDIANLCEGSMVRTSTSHGITSSINTSLSKGMFHYYSCPLFLNDIFNVANLVKFNDYSSYQLSHQWHG